MNWLDVLILAVCGTAAITGLRVGGIQVAVTGVSILAGTSLAGHQHGLVRPLVDLFTDSDNLAQVISFVLVMAAVLLASVALGFALRTVLKGVKLGWVDQLLGVSLALVITFAVGSALLSVVQSYPVGGLDGVIDGSVLGTFLADNFDTVLRGIRLVPKDLGV